MFCCGSTKKTNPGESPGATALVTVGLLIMRLFNQCLLNELDAAVKPIAPGHVELCICRRANVAYTIMYGDEIFANVCKQCIDMIIDIFNRESAKLKNEIMHIPMLVHAEI